MLPWHAPSPIAPKHEETKFRQADGLPGISSSPQYGPPGVVGVAVMAVTRLLLTQLPLLSLLPSLRHQLK
jgi:hypothetical protein